jgi:SAM-dependent methyltransferase
VAAGTGCPLWWIWPAGGRPATAALQRTLGTSARSVRKPFQPPRKDLARYLAANVSRMDPSPYLLDNAAPEAAQRFVSLTSLFDPVTFGNLEGTGVTTGWRCLEVGAGGGSVARWLAERVGDTGRVLATDLDLNKFAVDLANVEARRHDIASDPLPEAEFHLVHARLVLIHVPERTKALRQMVAALRPGGWLVIEDFDLQLVPTRAEGRTPDEQLVNKVTAAFTALLESRGAHSSYGRQLPRLMHAAGLVDVHAEGHLAVCFGGSPGARLMQANIEQTREQLVGTGLVTRDDTERFTAIMDQPGVILNFSMLMASRGRLPEGAGSPVPAPP